MKRTDRHTLPSATFDGSVSLQPENLLKLISLKAHLSEAYLTVKNFSDNFHPTSAFRREIRNSNLSVLGVIKNKRMVYMMFIRCLIKYDTFII